MTSRKKKSRRTSRPPAPLVDFTSLAPLRTKVRYVDTVSINPGAAGALAYATWNANSIYDPYTTGVGHQPLGRDQLAAIYSRYTVLGSRFKFRTFPSDNAHVQDIVAYGAMLSETSSIAASTFTTLIEQGSVFDVARADSVTYGGQGLPPNVSVTYDPRKFFGVKDPQDDDGMGADIGASPSRPAFFQAWIQLIYNADDIAGCVSLVEIDYEVLWSQPEEVVAS